MITRLQELAYLVAVTVLLFVASGCGREVSSEKSKLDDSVSSLPEIDIDKRNPGQLLKFYVNSFASDSSALVASAGRYFLDTDKVSAAYASALSSFGSDGTITWDELEPFINENYAEATGTPKTVASLRQLVGDWQQSDLWFHISVSGVMTSARREIYVSVSSLTNAIRSFESGNGLKYPSGTTFVAEHFQSGVLTETTTMQKRGDSHWDFGAYDEAGELKHITLPAAKAYAVPTQCVGCHYGNRAFEPEKSYPGAATPGPTGERVIHHPNIVASNALVAHFDEHRRRTDTVLGLYATLYIASLRNKAVEALSSDEKGILELVTAQ